jgi:F1F0 ATPase subunit 2
MSDWGLPLGAGLFLGAFFFGGLWWTVRKGLSAAQPALWFLFSLLLRTALTLAAFYLVAAGDWRRLLVCLAGFVAARFLVTHLAAPPSPPPESSSAREAGDAS